MILNRGAGHAAADLEFAPDSEPNSLEIFDFDWTLFRSPIVTPAKKMFIHSPESLEPPYAPWRPGLEFWIERTVHELRASQRRPRSLTVMMTARRAKTQDRILHLLEQRTLHPDIAIFRPASFQRDKDRVFFKRTMTAALLNRYPTISKIVLWEDEEEQIEGIRDLARRRRIRFEGHHIQEVEWRIP